MPDKDGLNLLPVLLGADMNCYSVARAFHEEYGVKSHAFGRYAMGETKYSRIVKVTAVPDIDTDEVMLETLAAFAEKHPNEQKILMGCTDDYAAMIIRNREELGKNYIVPYIGAELMENLVSKENFYKYCEAFDIPYPATEIVEQDTDPAIFDMLPFAYPIIIKPSSSIQYWKHPFAGMKKVYVAKTAQHAKEIAAKIFAAGYPDTLVVQDFIPGADSGMRVLTAYCDRNAKVKMMCYGQVLLEEHTPKAVGNHAAILTEYNGPLMEKIKNFLEDVGYTGYANFDIKFDPRDNTYRVFEINLRQGRSNYYVTGAGLNIAKFVVNDRLLLQDLGEPQLFAGESFWHSIPVDIVWKYTDGRNLIKRAKAIVAARKDTTTLGYAYDLRLNPLRQLYLWEHNRRYREKYAKYCKKPARKYRM
ncbi:ATP-grasp domain-containing protein [Ruminococcaceae bacterium OttesenSCG-928-A16]|nr:ATP-grasp domain-containing protein [Ruminococcaceae bacterium OttesenSCG-928-A16]